MKVFVYGTLKRGYWNSEILVKSSQLIRKTTVQGYMLYDVGFPVALPNAETKVSGEVWDIGDPNTTQSAKETLLRLDALEGEGRMYNRLVVQDESGEDVHMYVGHPNCWNTSNERLRICPVKDGAYVWSSMRN